VSTKFAIQGQCATGAWK